MKAFLLVNAKDGEVERSIDEDEKIIIRSKKQQEIAKEFYSRDIVNNSDYFYKSYHQLFLVRLFSNDSMTYLVLNLLANFIDNGSNFVIKNGERYTISLLAKDLGISRQTSSRCVKKLKDIGLVQSIDTTKGTYLCVNPYYFNKNNEFPKKILEKFSKKLKI